MPSISSYFNPCSKEFNSMSEFQTLSCIQKTVIQIVTGIVALLSLGLLAIPVFRLLVGRVTVLPPEELPPTTAKTDVVAQAQLNPNTTLAKSQEQLKTSSDENVEPPVSKIKTAMPIVNVRIKGLQTQFAVRKLNAQEMYELSLGYPDSRGAQISQPTPIQMLTRLVLNQKLTKEKRIPILVANHIHAIDNGDCFFHAFAQVLNVILKRRKEAPVTSVELRKVVSDYVNDQKNQKEIQELFKLSSPRVCDNLQKYKENIGMPGSEGTPIWGQMKVDGQILCQIYNVNAKVWGAQLLIDEDNIKETVQALFPKGGVGWQARQKAFLANSDNWACGSDENDNVENIPGATETIEIAGSREHFHPVFKQGDVEVPKTNVGPKPVQVALDANQQPNVRSVPKPKPKG